MKPGTPGFVGERLREAREAHEMTITALSEILGVSKQAISQYEKGVQTPRPEVMERLAARLNLPMRFFLQPRPETAFNTVFFRSMSSATNSARGRGKIRFGWLKEMVAYLRQFVLFKDVHLPDFDIPQDPLVLNPEKIEWYARECRRKWDMGDGAITNVVLLLENNGIVVTRGQLGEKLDAFSEWSTSDNTPYIFLGTDKQTAVRSRFDAAHELGHLLLHRSIPKNLLNNSRDFNLIERQADRFAAAFLLPAEIFLRDLSFPSLDAFRVLKEKWKVSIQMMIMRCWHLNIVNDEERQRLFVNLNRRGWRKKEPLDDRLAPERPVFLRRCFELLIENHVQSREDILSTLPFRISDIEELTELPKGFLEEQGNKIEPLPRLASPRSDRRPTSGADIIPFKRQ